MITRAVRFLQKYRILEGILEKQYPNRKNTAVSPIIEYLHDDDSEPIRTDLNLLREIRNILSHNSDSDGDPVIEPSEETLDRLDAAIAYVTRKRRADRCGTGAENVLYAKPSNLLRPVMQRMHEKGYSHVPILENGTIRGILTIRSIFDYACDHAPGAFNDETRISDLEGYTGLNDHKRERFLFVSADTDIDTIRKSFSRRWDRNRRLTLVLVTEHGTPNEPLLRLITAWDAISDTAFEKEEPADEQFS